MLNIPREHLRIEYVNSPNAYQHTTSCAQSLIFMPSSVYKALITTGHLRQFNDLEFLRQTLAHQDLVNLINFNEALCRLLFVGREVFNANAWHLGRVDLNSPSMSVAINGFKIHEETMSFYYSLVNECWSKIGDGDLKEITRSLHLNLSSSAGNRNAFNTNTGTMGNTYEVVSDTNTTVVVCYRDMIGDLFGEQADTFYRDLVKDLLIGLRKSTDGLEAQLGSGHRQQLDQQLLTSYIFRKAVSTANATTRRAA